VIEKALEVGAFLEINGQPDRLDLRDVHARAAKEAGLKLLVNSDAHEGRLAELRRVRDRAGAARLVDEGRRRQHAHLEAVREAAAEASVSDFDFRRDGAAALDWAAGYLDRLDDLPVLAQVQPGELSAKLPLSPPEEGEPFASVLHDLDELICAGADELAAPALLRVLRDETASEPGILAELIAATLNQVAILWRASPASTELELRTVDWVRQLLGLPDGWHGHIEDTASTSTLAALIAARHVTGRNVVVCSEHAHSSVEKAGPECSAWSCGRSRADEELRMRTDGLELGDVAAVVATVGSTSFASVDRCASSRGLAHAAGAWLQRRRGVRRLVVDLRGGAAVAGRRRARRLARRQSAQSG